MRRFKNYELQNEDILTQMAAGRYNPAIELKYSLNKRQYTVMLSAGQSDRITIYREGNTLYVLSTNYNLGYIGLEIFEKGEIAGELFIDNPEEQLLIKNWESKSEVYLIKLLNEYIY
jgi:predicted regulator of Ras-like GTPase activity (Roadblock/LC7/MglB family)